MERPELTISIQHRDPMGFELPSERQRRKWERILSAFDSEDWQTLHALQRTAFRKLFQYGHQTPRLLVIWLDPDDGLHKRVCKAVAFPNAEVHSVTWYYPRLDQTTHGQKIVRKLEILKGLRHKVP